LKINAPGISIINMRIADYETIATTNNAMDGV
jgi:hypothetical protein